MTVISMTWVATALGALTIFLVNALWFGPKTFYSVWWRALGKEVPRPEDQDTSAKAMARLFGSGLAAAIAQAMVLTFVIAMASQSQDTDLIGGALIGLAFGIVAAGASLPHRLFGQQGFKVWLIEIGADVVSLVVAGLIIATLV